MSERRSVADGNGPASSIRGGLPVGTLEVRGASPGILALHGFGATPHEVAMAIDVARDLGLRALAPLLPGHGLSVSDLARTRFADWQRGARTAFEELAQAGPVIVVGSSMGSLLAMDLAADHQSQVIGLVAMAPALRLGWFFPGLALAVVSALRIPDFSIPKAQADIRDPNQRKSQVTYARQPAHAGNEVRLAGHHVERRLREIRCPALIIHGRHDHVCPLRGAKRVFAGLGTPRSQKELLILPRSYHIVTRDVERGLVRTRLYEFVRRLALEPRAQRPVEP